MTKLAKIIIGVIAALCVALGAYLFVRPSSFVSMGTVIPDALPTSAVPIAPPSLPADSIVMVAYTDNGFSPSSVSIKKGATVRFINQSIETMRVASNPHPIHNGYPTTGGCVSSTFDSCRGIAPGDSWSFTFDIAGTWGYHNHMNPGKQGKVTVQ